MSEFLPCRVALGKHRYVGQWREVGEWTLVCCGELWDCAPTLRQPPKRVAEMLLKRMVEKGSAPPREARAPEITILAETASPLAA